MDHHHDTVTEFNGAEKENGVNLINGSHDPTFIDLNIHTKKDIDNIHNDQKNAAETNGLSGFIDEIFNRVADQEHLNDLKDSQCCSEVPNHPVEDVHTAGNEIASSPEVVLSEHEQEEKSADVEVQHSNADRMDNEIVEEKFAASSLESQILPTKVEVSLLETQFQESQCCSEVPNYPVEDVHTAGNEIGSSPEVVLSDHEPEEKSTDVEVYYSNADHTVNEISEETVTQVPHSEVEVSFLDSGCQDLKTEEVKDNIEASNGDVLSSEVNHGVVSDEAIPDPTHSGEEVVGDLPPHDSDRSDATDVALIEMADIKETESCVVAPEGNAAPDNDNHVNDESAIPSKACFIEHKSDDASAEERRSITLCNDVQVERVENSTLESQLTKVDVSSSELKAEQSETAAISKDVTGGQSTQHSSEDLNSLAEGADKLVKELDVTPPSEVDNTNMAVEDISLSKNEESTEGEVKPQLTSAPIEQKSEEKMEASASVCGGGCPVDQSTSDKKVAENHKKRKFCTIM